MMDPLLLLLLLLMLLLLLPLLSFMVIAPHFPSLDEAQVPLSA